jgi:hypothetical protein
MNAMYPSGTFRYTAVSSRCLGVGSTIVSLPARVCKQLYYQQRVAPNPMGGYTLRRELKDGCSISFHRRS